MSSAHISPSLGTKYAIRAATDALSVALIGPHEKRRRSVADALAKTHRSNIREFDSYPPEPDHLHQLLGAFDVVVLDGDSDPDVALGLVEEMRDNRGAPLIVFSEKGDRALAARFLRAGAREFLLLPLDAGLMSEALIRATTLRPKLVCAEKLQGKLLVLAGSKGGSGATTVACNLAIALAELSKKSVLLVDLALPIGDAALCLGMAAEYSTEDALRAVDRLDAALLETFLIRHKSGVFVLAAPARVPEIEFSRESIEKLIAVARRGFDHVVVDVGSRIDVAGKALFGVANTTYLITQTGISELRNSNRVISQFFGEGSPNLEVVVNRFEPSSPASGDEEVIYRALGRPVRWKIPDNRDAARVRTSEVGVAETPIGRTSLEMAASVLENPSAQTEKSTSEYRGHGRSAAQVNPRENDPPNTTIVTTVSRPVPPAVTWPTPAPITYGEKLGAIQLNAKASVPGKFVYTPGPGYILPTGTHTLWVTFTPAESWDDPLQVAVSIVVTRATPELSWPPPPEVRRGAPLDERHLNAACSVSGKFDYSPGAGELLPPGTHTLSVTFTPADPANYNAAHATQIITVARAVPVIDWPVLSPLAYGTQLSAEQLCASAQVPGVFEYTPSAGAVLAAGEHPLCAVFTPADTSAYLPVRRVAPLIVAKSLPQIAWPAPAPITHGTALGPDQLNATADIPGAFSYTPAAGAILPPGVHQLTATFTPADSLDYTIARAVVSVLVAEKLPVSVSWPAPSAIPYGIPLAAAQLTATASVAGKFVFTPAEGNVLAPGIHTLSAAFIPDDPEKYATARATVELEVKGLPEIPSSPVGNTKALSTGTLDSGNFAPVRKHESTEPTLSQTTPRETRTYRGAVYEKGEDGQWHLQKK